MRVKKFPIEKNADFRKNIFTIYKLEKKLNVNPDVVYTNKHLCQVCTEIRPIYNTFASLFLNSYILVFLYEKS